ncbi:GFA family protein [Acinetobacter bereziniae]
MNMTLNAQCHCGAVKFTVELSDNFETIRRCNCSFCRMRGAVAVSAPLSGINVYEGHNKLTEYRFNTKQAAIIFVQFVEFILFINVAPILSSLE